MTREQRACVEDLATMASDALDALYAAREASDRTPWDDAAAREAASLAVVSARADFEKAKENYRAAYSVAERSIYS